MIRKNSAFTLVEILIVVIILGILAAIVIPQFSQASNDARLSSLTSDLQSMRSQIQLYKVQHLESYPGATFTTVMTSRTNSSGTTGTDPNSFPYGPYLQSVPGNPFVSGAAALTVTTGTGNPAGDSASGWYYNTTTGAINANDNGGHTAL